MNNNNDTARQENRKALPKFIFIFIAAMIGGGILGFAMAFAGFENLRDALSVWGRLFSEGAAPWLLVALPVVELLVCLPLYSSAKKRLAGWDGEDEAVSESIEKTLSVGIWATGMAIILGFFLTAALFSGFLSMEGNPMRMSPVKFFGGLGGFLVMLIVTLVLQQKLVDATKKLYPEKHGSVYDTKFQKKWLDSCDEAEKAVIGQCALKAYQATTYTCLVLWAVFALGGLFFSWGLLPAMAVCIVWAVNQSVYSYWAIRLARPGTAL